MSRAPVPPTPAPARAWVISILNEVALLPEPQRALRLTELCAGDAPLRAEVESLLAHLCAAPAFLEDPPADVAATPAETSVGPLAPGTRVLRYRIERLLGEGGMGVVYLARQEHPDRAVALKLIRPIAATPALMRRFAREAEMLGRLQHPGIGQIFEAGTADLGGGVLQPFLAMEFVEGTPLTEYARSQRLDTRQRMALTARLAEAVEHAHQRGVIHRDLKPANILVTDRGDPKVLDFGVARAVDGVNGGATRATEAGMLVGTLAYMSPEQYNNVGEAAERAGLDTRSDIYALGVIMYELLCDRLPHDLAGLSLVAAAKAIQEREPVRPGVVKRELRGDIETIILTAMARDRDRRYPSTGALREDIRRCLAGAPIVARQDSALYVLRKRMRRYRWALGAGALFVALLVGFGAWSGAQARAFRILAASEAEARERASAQERRAIEQLRVGNIERGRMLGLSGDLRGAERALWGARAENPGAEDAVWALRELYRRFPLVATLAAGDAELFSARFSPAGTLVATAGDRGDIHIWDVTDWTQIRSISGHVQRLSCLHFNSDGTLLASGGMDSVIRLWNTADWSPAGQLTGHTGRVHEMTFNRDGTRLFSTGQDGTVKLWDVPSRSMIREAQAKSTGWGVRLNPAQTHVLQVDQDGSVYVRDAETLNLEHEFTAHSNVAHCLAFSPDGTVLATGGREGSVALWNTRDWSLLRRSDLGIRSVYRIEFAPDGSRLVAVGSAATTVVRADTLDPAPPAIPPIRGGWGAEFSHDGRWLVTTSAGPGAARVWEVEPNDGTTSATPHSGQVIALACSADGSLLASGGADGSISLRDLATGTELRRWTSGSAVRALAFPIESDWLISSHASGTVRATRTDDAEPQFTDRHGHMGSVDAIAFLPDGRFVSGGNDGTVRVWEVASGNELARMQAGSGIVALTVSPNGKFIAANASERIAILWDAASFEPVSIGVERAGSLVRSLVFSPDSTRLLMPSRAGPVELWCPFEGRQIDQLNGHTRYVVRVALNAEGTLIASSGQDGLLNVWDVESGRCLASLTTGELTVQNMVWLPDPRRFVLSCNEGQLVFISLDTLDGRILGIAANRNSDPFP